MDGTADAHRVDFNKLAQMTGRTGPIRTNYAYAAQMNVAAAHGTVLQIQTDPAVGNATVNMLGLGLQGEFVELEIANDGTAARTITFGTNFRSTGTVVGTPGKSIIVGFRSNGSGWLEAFRSAAAV